MRHSLENRDLCHIGSAADSAKLPSRYQVHPFEPIMEDVVWRM